MSNNYIVDEIANAKKKYEHSLILNPTENVPLSSQVSLEFAENLYTPEEPRNESNKVIFAGRNAVYPFYKEWCQLLDADDASFKANSGLDAHILLFMSVSSYGDKVLLLPEVSGGHFSTKKILLRLGLDVKDFIIDINNQAVDIKHTSELIINWKPQFIFVDRSEGLYYEDFSWLKKFDFAYKIFDASQYLSNIMAKDYLNPYEMGFDLILSTLHKNYPGPQKAAFFTKDKSNPIWKKLKKGLATYVSNIHPREIYKALLTIPNKEYLTTYSKNMLDCAKTLDIELQKLGIPTVKREFSKPFTQQIWITCESQSAAYKLFRDLESVNIYTNYRLLPYNLGYGIRLGTAGAVRQGLKTLHCKLLAQIIDNILNKHCSLKDIEEMTNILLGEISGSNRHV